MKPRKDYAETWREDDKFSTWAYEVLDKKRWKHTPEPVTANTLFAGISPQALTYVAALIIRDLAELPDDDSVKGYPLYQHVAQIARALKELAR